MNNYRLSPIISLLIVLLSSVIIDTHARYHHTEVLPRRHRHRHHSPSSSSLNSVSHRHNANSQHEGKKSPPLYEDTLAYEELYEDSDYPEDYDSLEEDYNYEDYEVRPRRRRFRDHSRFANYRGSRLNRRRFFVRERNFEPDYYDEDYNYNRNHNHNRNRNFKADELEIPRRHRKDFVKRRPSFGLRKGYAVRRQTGRKIADYDSEEEFEFDREHKKKHNLTGNNNNNVNFVHDKDKEVDKEEEDKEEEDIWKEADEADDEEEDDDEEEKNFDDKDFMKMDDSNYFYKGAKREYRNIDVDGSRGVVRKEVRSVSSSEEFRREKGFENSNFREKPLKIRVRDEDYDRRNLQSDNGEEPEEEEETSAPITISAPKSTTMMSTAAVSTTALASASRPVITGQTYERRDSRFSDPTSSSSTSHGTHKVPVKEIKSLPGNNNANKSGKSAEIREALQHAMKVSREGSCQWPRARVIPVRDVYPSPSTTYIPHCAILHRCSDDTGCCRSESLTCVPKQFHKVELYFYTTSIGGGSVVEKLSFYNHTECECREKTEYGMQNDNKLQESNEFKSHVNSGRQHQSLVPQNIRKPVTKKPCRCPSEFTPRMNFDGECVCDCFENDQNCFRARRGKGYFSYRDRLCIQNEECAVPSCEFGDYIKRQGRCPRKKEKFDEIANYPNHMNYHNRHRS